LRWLPYLVPFTRKWYSLRTVAENLTRDGDSLALTTDPPHSEGGIDADTQTESFSEGDVLVISPARAKKRIAELEEILDKLDREHAGAFRRLAE
jgi:hypothetical protein